MGHTLDALRSRNSASLAPRPASERQMRLDAGRCASEKNGTSQAVLGGLDLTKLDSRGQLDDRCKQASKRTHEEFTRRESSQDSSQVCKKNQTTKGSLSNVLRKPAVVEGV